MAAKGARAKVDKLPHDGTHYICKCECGGGVRGVKMGEAGYTASFCTRCTPVVKVNVTKLRAAIAPQEP